MPKSTGLFDAFAKNLRDLLSLVDFTINDGEFFYLRFNLSIYHHQPKKK